MGPSVSVASREIRNLVIADLMKSSLYLFYCDTTIVSEFPCNYEFDVPYETEGIPGAFAVAKVLSYLGKKVTLLYSGEQIGKILSECMALFDWSKASDLIELKSLAPIEVLMQGWANLFLSGPHYYDQILKTGPTEPHFYWSGQSRIFATILARP